MCTMCLTRKILFYLHYIDPQLDGRYRIIYICYTSAEKEVYFFGLFVGVTEGRMV